jgi:hypothetical protein
MIKRKPEVIEDFREIYNKSFPKKPVSFEEAEVIMDNLIRLYRIVRKMKYPEYYTDPIIYAAKHGTPPIPPKKPEGL